MVSKKRTDSMTILGKVTSPYGIKGWLKVYSYTDPIDNILSYSDWILVQNGKPVTYRLEHGKTHGKGIVVKFVECADRTQAEKLCGSSVCVATRSLPELPDNDYYWHQLEGLEVYHSETGVLVGKVAYMMETGANDVIVVKPSANSIDKKERLVPYLPDQVVKKIDIDNQKIDIDWDLDF
ncbi:MAG: ribosome maturation factor RimM [Gammaproteobacteria bacterium]|nr:MAG: ribosome maturation factor RimM [Gammaproteobacteria bacterium]